MPLRIGVNALYLIPGGVGGTEIYLRQLLAALAAVDSINEYRVVTNRETGRDLLPEAKNFKHEPQPVRARFRPARILWEQFVLPFREVDVLLNPGFTAPVFSRCPQVTVFHDLQHYRHPEYFRWFDLPFWRSLLWASAHRSQAIITVSEATRADFLRYYEVPRERVHVIHHGVDRIFFDLPRSDDGEYVLCVSTLHPHKNLRSLVSAFRGIDRSYRLVIVGMRGFFAKELEDFIQAASLGDRIRVTGWVAREELYSLYARASALVYPSTFEGFGMPVLEGMAAGLPVVCSDIPPLREVAGDAAYFFDPDNESAIQDAIARVLHDDALRTRLSLAGPRRAAGFTWERAARETLNVINLLAGVLTRSSRHGT
jgi:glycosyltransferase involved in cell wall biosynthesis